MKEHFQGIMQTIWTHNDLFLKEYYPEDTGRIDDKNTSSNCFKKIFEAMKQ